MSKCPTCKSEQSVRPSHKKKFELPRLFGMRPFRCDACGTRFYRFPDAGRATLPSRNTV